MTHTLSTSDVTQGFNKAARSHPLLPSGYLASSGSTTLCFKAVFVLCICFDPCYM